MFSLKDRTALVTGSTQGIGLGILKVLARAGANVVMNSFERPPEIDKLLAEVSSHGNKAVFIQSDVTKASERERLFKESLQAFGRFDILVSSAGTFCEKGMESVTEEMYDRLMNLNTKPAFFLSKLAIEHWRATKSRGSIVLVASTNGLAAERGAPVYDTSKGALVMMSRTLAVQTLDDDITVNTLCPGLIETPLTRGLCGDEKTFRRLAAGVPKKRWGTTEECGYAVLYMVSDEGHYMTGQNMVLDGGILAIQHTAVDNLGA